MFVVQERSFIFYLYAYEFIAIGHAQKLNMGKNYTLPSEFQLDPFEATLSFV